MSTSEENATDKIEDLPVEIQNIYHQMIRRISRAVTTVDNMTILYNAIVNSIQEDSNYYSVNLYIVDPDNKWAVLKAGTNEEIKSAIQHGHKLAIDEQSIVSRAINTRFACIAMIKPENPTIPYPSADLPPVRSELCVPLISIQKDIIGVLDVQSEEYEAFYESESVMFIAIAKYIVSLLDDKNLF